MPDTESQQTLLIYDRECPFCHDYCQRVRVLQTVGELTLIDAREDSEAMQQITQRGWDIDQGMVLKTGEQWYYGSDAIHALALISSQVGWFNRFNYWVFKSPKRARILYPMLRSLRNLALKLMRKTKINNLDIEGNQRF